MKKFTTFLLMAILALNLAACGGNSDTPNGNNDTTSSPGTATSSPPQQGTDSPMRMSISDIANMNSDRLDILLAMPQPDDYSLDVTLGDIRIHAVPYADDHDLVDYKIYDDSGSEVYAGVGASQNQSYGIWVEVIPPEDFDWGLDSISTVKIEFTDAVGNELSDEYNLDEILVSYDDAANWLSDMQSQSESADGNDAPAQSTSPDGDTSPTDNNAGFTLDAGALEAADDPLAYVLQELNKVYQNQLGEIDGLYLNNDPAQKSIKLYFRNYELSVNDINGLIESPQTYMPDIERIIGEIIDSFAETEYYPFEFRFYIFLGGNRVCDITCGDTIIDSTLYIYEGDVYYQYKEGAWAEHPYSDRMVPREDVVNEYVY